MSLQEFNMDW